MKENQFCRQHHFWLRFNNELLGSLHKDLGVQHVGDIDFTGDKNRYSKGYNSRTFHASVYLDFKKKYRARFLGVLGLKKREEYSLKDDPQKQRTSTPNSMPSDVAIRQSIANVNANAGGIVHVPKKVKVQTPPVVKKVAVNRMESESLEEGCKVLSATSSPKVNQFVDQFNP